MAAKALFRTASYSVTDDDATTIGQSVSVVVQSTGMRTPNATFNYAHGQQRLDTLAQMVGSPLIAAAGTYTATLVAMLTSERVLLRIVGPGSFDITVTPLSTPAYTVSIVGSQYQPGIFEATLETATAISITNTGTAATRFVVAAATIVDYNDPRLAIDEGSSLVSNLNLLPGFIPLGGIIPVGGTYSLANNAGVYDEGLVLPLPDWLQYCDGAAVLDTASIMFGRFVPNLSDDRFIMGAGSTSPGTLATAYAGVNTRDLTHIHTGGLTGTANLNTTTRTTNVTVATQPAFTVDAHTHVTSIGFTAAQITQPTFTVTSHTHAFPHSHPWSFTVAGTGELHSPTAADPYGISITAANTLIANGTTVTAGAPLLAWTSVNTAAGQRFTTGATAAAPASGSGLNARTGSQDVSTTTRTTDAAIAALNFGSNNANLNTTTRTTDVTLGQPTFTVDAHTHTVSSTGAATWTDATVQAAPTAIDIRPRWIAFKMYMRIK